MIRLKLERTLKGITQKELWIKTGIDTALISRAENHKFRLSGKQLGAIASVLGWNDDPMLLLHEVE